MNTTPTAAELATIAAALAKNPNTKPAPIIARALLFYEAAQKHLAEIAEARAEAQAKANEARRLKFPFKVKFPMKQDRLLRCLMPEYRNDTAKQGVAWREFRKSHPSFGLALEGIASAPVKSSLFLLQIWSTFRPWFSAWKAAKKSKARSEAGKKSHEPGNKRDKRRGGRPPLHALPPETQEILVEAQLATKRNPNAMT